MKKSITKSFILFMLSIFVLSFFSGDIILSIDDKSTAQLLQEQMEYISGSTQWKRFAALFYMLFGPADSKARLEIQY